MFKFFKPVKKCLLKPCIGSLSLENIQLVNHLLRLIGFPSRLVRRVVRAMLRLGKTVSRLVQIIFRLIRTMTYQNLLKTFLEPPEIIKSV